MFIQVMQGRCTRHEELRAVSDSWGRDIEAGAGWLGGTFGFTDDDLFIGVIRFESREAAMANSARPETEAWAQKFMATFDGDVEFHDCDDVTSFLEGGSDSAGFVQVIQGTISDRSLINVLVAHSDSLKQMRPEIIGGTFAVDADGGFTQTVAFTDEASARAGEGGDGPPPEVQEALGAMMASAQFYDLRSPWFESA